MVPRRSHERTSIGPHAWRGGGPRANQASRRRRTRVHGRRSSVDREAGILDTASGPLRCREGDVRPSIQNVRPQRHRQVAPERSTRQEADVTDVGSEPNAAPRQRHRSTCPERSPSRSAWWVLPWLWPTSHITRAARCSLRTGPEHGHSRPSGLSQRRRIRSRTPIRTLRSRADIRTVPTGPKSRRMRSRWVRQSLGSDAKRECRVGPALRFQSTAVSW